MKTIQKCARGRFRWLVGFTLGGVGVAKKNCRHTDINWQETNNIKIFFKSVGAAVLSGLWALEWVNKLALRLSL